MPITEVFTDRPTQPVRALRAAWLDAGRRICRELQMQLWQDVPYIRMGEYWQAAYRKDLLDVLPGICPEKHERAAVQLARRSF